MMATADAVEVAKLYPVFPVRSSARGCDDRNGTSVRKRAG
jgi:hypothetical protein